MFAQSLLSEKMSSTAALPVMDQGSRPGRRMLPGPTPPNTTSSTTVTVTETSVRLSGQKNISR